MQVEKQWKCTVCGYVHKGEEPPETCPLCGAPRSAFELLEEDVIVDGVDFDQ